MLLRVESLFNWPPDSEWTGRRERFTLLQARPITTAIPADGDQRGWYLSLRPGRRRLSALAERVAGQLIPELEALGKRLAAEAIEGYDDRALAAAIEERRAAVEMWRQIYIDDFIPFAHGVRQLGLYYNDAVQPHDPYEFVGLLKGQQMVASRRNRALQALAGRVRGGCGAMRHSVRRSYKQLSRGGRMQRTRCRPSPAVNRSLRHLRNCRPSSWIWPTEANVFRTTPTSCSKPCSNWPGRPGLPNHTM